MAHSICIAIMLCLSSSVLCEGTFHHDSDNDCPQDNSLFCENDIEYLINDFIEKNKEAMTAVTDNVQKFLDYKDYSINDLTTFCSQIHQKPEILKVMLQNIVSSAETVEPLLNKIAAKLRDIPTYGNMYDDKVYKYNQLLNSFNKYSKVCDAFCEGLPSTISPTRLHKELLNRNEQKQKYYCSSFQGLQNSIGMKVETFAEAYVEELNTAYLNWTNSIDIDGVKQIFTDEALETFAKPMYQVLSIKKQYGQLINFEKQLNFDSGFHDLQESMLDVDKNLLQLELVVEKYGKKCKDCSESNVLLKRMIELSTIATEEATNEELNLLDQVFMRVFSDFKQAVNEKIEIQNLEVIEALKFTKEELSLKLKDAKLDIDADVTTENKALEILKEIVPVKLVNEFLNVKKDFNILLAEIKDKVGVIEQLLN